MSSKVVSSGPHVCERIAYGGATLSENCVSKNSEVCKSHIFSFCLKNKFSVDQASIKIERRTKTPGHLSENIHQG